jgi:peptide/nickel transport system permease protein
MINAASRRDVPVVQTSGLIFAGAYVGLNTIADLLAIATAFFWRVWHYG